MVSGMVMTAMNVARMLPRKMNRAHRDDNARDDVIQGRFDRGFNEFPLSLNQTNSIHAGKIGPDVFDSLADCVHELDGIGFTLLDDFQDDAWTAINKCQIALSSEPRVTVPKS